MTRAIGKINKLSINKPISVSTFIFFLNKLYMLHKKATAKPTQGNEFKLNKRYKLAITIKIIEIILFLFNFSLEKNFIIFFNSAIFFVLNLEQFIIKTYV